MGFESVFSGYLGGRARPHAAARKGAGLEAHTTKARTQTKASVSYVQMVRYAKLILKILEGKSDANIKFDDLRGLLLKRGFEEPVRGSHHLYGKD